jgi:hypothetical protein
MKETYFYKSVLFCLSIITIMFNILAKANSFFSFRFILPLLETLAEVMDKI